MGIPNNAPDAKKSIELLKRIFIDKRPELLSRFTGATPGSLDALDLWTEKQKVSGSDCFKDSLLNSKVLTGRTAYDNWYTDVYAVIDEAAKNMLDIKSARKQIVAILNERRVRSKDITILA